jgi:hypothetical protein
LAKLLKSVTIAITLLVAKVIAIATPILSLKSIAITILILFAILFVAVILVLKQKEQKPVSGKHYSIMLQATALK